MYRKFVALTLVLSAGCTTPLPQADDDAALAIVGTWHQVDAECGVAEPVRELIFEADGRYSVTWLPFETYKDYWGRYRYNPRTHVLTLTVEGGNYNPPGRVLSGQAQVEEHALTLSGVSLGTPQNGARCTTPFRR